MPRVFNIMQYENHPFTGEKLLDEAQIKSALEHKSIKQWAYVYHDKDVYSEKDERDDKSGTRRAGDKKPGHWHVCCRCDNAVEVQVIAKWFGIPENFVDVPKGNKGKWLDIVEYLTHESDKQQALGKYRYPDEDIKANFQWREELDKKQEKEMKYGQALSTRDAFRYDVLYMGRSLKSCRDEDPICYMNDFEKLKKLRMEYLQGLTPPTTRINYYICGDGGYGKGLTSRALARALFPQLEDDEEIFFNVGSGKVPFDGYDGQPVLIWNDYRAGELMKALGGRGNVFNVFDTHPVKQAQNVKFGAVNLCNLVNIVNSVDDYATFLDGLAGRYTDRDGNVHEAEDDKQAKRRFPFIIPLHENDFDLLVNKGFFYGNGLFSEYEAYNHIRGSFAKVAHKIADEEQRRKIENMMLSLPVSKHNEVIGRIEESEKGDIDLSEFEGYGTIAE